MLGPRPKPELISFAADCFETAGFEIVYVVLQPSTASGPKTFSNQADALAYAKIRVREVITETRTISRRVKWF